MLTALFSNAQELYRVQRILVLDEEETLKHGRSRLQQWKILVLDGEETLKHYRCRFQQCTSEQPVLDAFGGNDFGDSAVLLVAVALLVLKTAGLCGPDKKTVWSSYDLFEGSVWSIAGIV